MNRRSLLAGILAAGFAPAAIGSGVLMPVRRILTPVAFPFEYAEGRVIWRSDKRAIGSTFDYEFGGRPPLGYVKRIWANGKLVWQGDATAAEIRKIEQP